MADAHKTTPSKGSNQRFGPYVVGDTIGRGTFAKVKLAVHETTKVRVALKVIPRKVMENDAHSSLKIKREIKVMKVLRHPHITRLYDVVQTKHDIVLVLEFVSGGELFEYILQKGRVDEVTCRGLFQQLAAAVAYCHRYRVTHRDIKPENIMLEHGSHNVKLSDFGLSSITHDGRFFETSCGTPNYASPEVVSGQLYSGPETDVWSCGVVLYAMLTGTLPFDDKNVSALFKKIQSADYPPPRHVSREVTDLIRRMLLVNPLDRATMEQVMQHPWLRPQFPQYLLSLHYEAALDTMRFAKDHTVSKEMLDEEVVRVVAARFHVSAQEVAAVVTKAEEKVGSMWSVDVESPSGKVVTRRYPAAHYWETFSNVLDAKLWPTPLEIVPAEVALREQSHDMVVSYLILTQKKQNKLGPEESAKRSFGESATCLLQFQSQQGYGSLNANSLHQASASSSLTGSYLSGTTPLQRQRSEKKTSERSFHLLPEKTPSTSDHRGSESTEDAWLEGYNYLSAPFLPLHHELSRHTLLGSVLKVTEFSVRLMRARKLDVQSVPRTLPNSASDSCYQRPTPFFLLSAANTNEKDYTVLLTPDSLLRPLGSPAAEGSQCGLYRSKEASTLSMAKGSSHSISTKVSESPSRDRAAAGHTKDSAETESVLSALFNVTAATRFGNDFMRNGVLFRPTTPQETLQATYRAMREEGLLWRVIYDYYFSCVRFPNVKLQVKIYKVSKSEQIVDVKVSVQSGMESFDAAVSLLDRLRTKAVNINNSGHAKPKKKSSLLAHFSTPIVSLGKQKSTAGTFSSAGRGSVASIPSTSSVTSKRRP